MAKKRTTKKKAARSTKKKAAKRRTRPAPDPIKMVHAMFERIIERSERQKS